MHPEEYNNWVKIKKTFEENGTTDNFYYQRACTIVATRKDPMDKYGILHKIEEESKDES